MSDVNRRWTYAVEDFDKEMEEIHGFRTALDRAYQSYTERQDDFEVMFVHFRDLYIRYQSQVTAVGGVQYRTVEDAYDTAERAYRALGEAQARVKDLG